VTDSAIYPPIHLGSPGEDISKKDLHAIGQRFKNLNQLRMRRVQDTLQARQRIFLNILPLLFHQNHPLLPGFSSSESPAGIPDYTPNKLAITAAKQFSKGFTFKRKALLNYPIQGIFLMGSVGSIAFSKTSDMDIWLCHQPSLAESEIKELQQKASVIENWADSLGLEVHFFLVNSETFSKGKNIPISSESSGNTQHYLLLDEFYRTAIFIAGRIPAWWLVPPHQEYNYSAYLQHLIDNRFVSENEIIDFGGLSTIPAEEFISATFWHIYKALNSPHKSLLKLFLMESYVNEYPKPQWLSFDLKSAIYQGNINVNDLDPYLLIYAKVERYLRKNNSTQRINLARECFYLKIMGGPSNSLDYKSREYREDYMHGIATQWQWPEDLFAALHKHKFWDIKKATQEHIVIRTQLKHCLRMILRLAGNYVDSNYRDNQDLKLLSRKLHVFLERKPGKTEIITTRSAVHTQENELSIVESKNRQSNAVWSLYSGRFNNNATPAHSAIKQLPSLLELLVWLVINGLYNKQLHLRFTSVSLTMHRAELHLILEQLHQFLSKKIKANSETLDVYSKPDKIIASLNIINLGLSHIDEREDGMMVLSERSDPLSYGKNHDCFILRTDRLSVSRWGEITVSQYAGLDGYFSCLSNIFNTSLQPLSEDSVKTICYTPTRANSIILRSNCIVENLTRYFFKQLEVYSNRYFLCGKHLTYIFQKNNGQLRYWAIDSKEELLQELAKTRSNYGEAYFDPNVFENSVIPYIYSLNQTQTIQVYYLSDNGCIDIYIIDEKGALYIQRHSNANVSQVLNNYSLFLESVSTHFFYQDNIQLVFYEIKIDAAKDFSFHPAKWNDSRAYTDLSIRIVIEEPSSYGGATEYFIYCNDIEFSTIDFGDQLFKEITNYILDFRNSGESYPIYISDIDIPCTLLGSDDEAQLQTIHYLNYKKKIEGKLNV